MHRRRRRLDGSFGPNRTGVGAIVLATGEMQGPAAARNLAAAAAKSALLLFLDSDVCFEPDSLTRVVALFAGEADVSAAFGSYDDTPAQQDFLSQYRNLMRHFVHQRSRRTVQTFWSGFGAIRTAVFSVHGGFDTSFGRPSIEDVELGHRLYRSGCKIILDPTIQVKPGLFRKCSGPTCWTVPDPGPSWSFAILKCPAT